MKLSLQINRHTTDSELIHLGNFFTALGANRGARVVANPTFTVPMDEAELQEPETPIAQADDGQAQTQAEAPAGTEAPKRRRRTKDEIEAERVAKGEAEAQVNNEAALAALTQPEEVAAAIAADPELAAAVGNDQPAPTQTVPVTEAAAPVAASASPSDKVGPITHAEAQKQAIDVARRFGPEKVKAIIGEYEGVGKIADLKDDDLVGFVAKLQALAA